jgi:hypothetical protein
MATSPVMPRRAQNRTPPSRFGGTQYAGSQPQTDEPMTFGDSASVDPRAGFSADARYSNGGYGGQGGYDAGGAPQYSPNMSESDPYEMFKQDRRSWYDRGNRLDQDARDEQARRFGLEGTYRNQMDSTYGDLLNNPGYTPDEQANILRQDELGRLGLTQDQVNGFQFRDDEQAAIMGNPNSQRGWYNPAEGEGIVNQVEGGIRGSMDDWRNTAYGTWGEGAGLTRSAIDNAQLGPGADYMGSQDAYLGGGSAGIRGAYGNPNLQMDAGFMGNQNAALAGGDSAVRGFTGNQALGADAQYMQDMQFGPEAQQEMEQSARTSIGNYGRSMRDRVERNAAQSGINSPLALAAGLNNLQGQNAIDQEDAALNARVAARRLGLDTTQRREDTRLGAEQFRGNLGAQSELGLLRNRVATNEGMEGMRLSAAGRQAALGLQGEGMIMNAGLGAAGEREGFRSGAERARMGARVANEQDLMRTGIGVAGDLGRAGIGAATAIGDRRTDTHRYNTDTGIGIERDIDRQQTARSLGLAANRQQTAQQGQQAMFNQGFQTNNALAQRHAGIADARRGDQNEYRGWATGQTNQQAQLGQNARQQRVSNFGTQAGAVNNSTSNYGQYDLARRGLGFGTAFKQSAGRALGNFAVNGAQGGG